MSPHHLPALILALIGAAFLLRWLIGDRSRGRRRCPKCWYDMAGIDAAICPECGRTARSERALFRTRRRQPWLLAGIATVLLTAYTATTAQIRRGENWTRYVPTTLYLLTDRTVAPGAPLYRRLSSHAMWDWQARIAFRRLLPPNVRQHGHQPHIAYPTVWPAGMPVPLVYDHWHDSFPLASIGKTTTILRDPVTGADLAREYLPFTAEKQFQRMWRGHAVISELPRAWYVAPGLNQGRRQLAIDVELITPWRGSSLVIQRTRAAFPIQTVDHADDLCKPVDAAELTTLLRSTLRLDPSLLSWSIEDETRPRWQLAWQASFAAPPPPLDDVAIGVRFEFLRNNEIVGTARYLVPAGNTNVFSRNLRGLDIEGDWHAILDATSNPEGWTVRVTSDLDAVFSDVNVKPHYWRGQFTVPLADIAKPILP